MAGEVFAARGEHDVDELLLALVGAVAHPLEALRVVGALGRRLAEHDALHAVQLEPAQLVDLARALALLGARVEGGEARVGGEVAAHRRDADDERGRVPTAGRAPHEAGALGRELLPLLRDGPGDLLLLPRGRLPARDGRL